jgi:hypothetical protein
MRKNRTRRGVSPDGERLLCWNDPLMFRVRIHGRGQGVVTAAELLSVACPCGAIEMSRRRSESP